MKKTEPDKHNPIKPSKHCFMNYLLALGLVTFSLTPAYAIDQRSDAHKEAKIENMISSNEVLQGYNINVTVDDKKASLNGTVALETQKDLAEAIALSATGVTSVDNDIKVREGEPRGTVASIGKAVSDATTTAKVKSKLLWSRSLSGMDIEVKSNDGTVTLGGEVNSNSEKELAKRLALNTSGVERVNNNISVSRSPTRARLGSVDFDKVEHNAGDALEQVGDNMSDGWLTTKVRSNLMFTRSLNISNLNVTSDNGHVKLEGTTKAQSEKDLASEIAKDTSGVKNVDNKITVIK